MSGKKFDQNKPDLSLVPYSALVEEAKGFMLGAEKYGRYNYTQGLEATRLVAAALRHIALWNQGEDLDSESGASHLGHARCCLAMILECQRLGTLKDNRHGKSTSMIVPQHSGIKPEDLGKTRISNGTEMEIKFSKTAVKQNPLDFPAHEWNPLDYVK